MGKEVAMCEYCISIHTPARGVTYAHTVEMPLMVDFNPHSRTGSDGICAGIVALYSDFNPHSRTGSDDSLFVLHNGTYQFQSTLPHGE